MTEKKIDSSLKLLVGNYLVSLFEVLGYICSFNFKECFNSITENIDLQAKYVKEEIEIRIESLKNELEKTYEALTNHVDNLKNNIVRNRS
jgi:hypothetical protein